MASKRRTVSTTLPAPTKGWNARDAISEMKPGYAVKLDNWIPRQNRIELRKGSTSHTTGLGAAVHALEEWAGPTSQKLFGFANNKIWDTSAAGAASDVTAGTAITANRWLGQNFGSRLTIVQDGQVPRQYDGSNWADTTFTGVTQTLLANISSYRSRLYFPESGKLKVWYGGADSVSGALNGFDMQYVFRNGGYLMACGSMSRDAGDGADDVKVFVSSTGEILVYEGAYPGETVTNPWGLIGRYNSAAPIGRKCLLPLGGDLAIVTKIGIIRMSTIIREATEEQSAFALTDTISKAFNDATRAYGDNNGWEPLLYPRATLGIVNVPIVDGSQSHQYVWETITGAWCRFTGLQALCWGLFQGKPYFGGADGVVYEFDTGASDDGDAISGDVRPAFSYLGRRGIRKQFHLAKPIIEADAAVSASIDLEVDYRESNPVNLIQFTGDEGTAWDDDDWDDFNWGGGAVIYDQVYGITGLGDAASLRIRSMTIGVTMALNAYALYWEPASWV